MRNTCMTSVGYLLKGAANQAGISGMLLVLCVYACGVCICYVLVICSFVIYQRTACALLGEAVDAN